MITMMITNGRFTESILPPGTTSMDTIFISPPLLPAYPTRPTQPSYSSASALSTQFRRIHTRSFFQNKTSSTVSASQETPDTTTRITLYSLFFIISCCALFSLCYFLNHICKFHLNKLQKRYNYECHGEFEGLITRRILFRYRTFDATSPYNAEENRRPVSSARSIENRKYTNPVNDTKATKAINAIKAGKAIQTTQTTDDHPSEAEWESAHSSQLSTPNRRNITWAPLPRPIRRPSTNRQPAAAGGIRFAASPPRPSRSNRPTRSIPPQRLRSPPLPPDFLTISNATTAPMGIPGQEPSSWDVGLPWVTTTDRLHIGDEGKKDRDMDADDENWEEIDRIISNERDQYADDKKVLDAARRKDMEREGES
ncbi:hypothetical protein BGAL_0134g00180 [Botrytis galanthina]|uniref:Uncharacterized protein n=1 Tax=Botrytis galanthina TaxID=278940 RepID=A0A4V4HUV3_9HELO|nr:hypothetical protein BGAL_0134g00180 [Botrytis galanthina]